MFTCLLSKSIVCEKSFCYENFFYKNNIMGIIPIRIGWNFIHPNDDTPAAAYARIS